MVFINSMTFHDQGAPCIQLTTQLFCGENVVQSPYDTPVCTTCRRISCPSVIHLHWRIIYSASAPFHTDDDNDNDGKITCYVCFTVIFNQLSCISPGSYIFLPLWYLTIH